MSTEHEHKNERETTPTVPTNFISACATIFTEKRDASEATSRAGLALRELLVSAFTGLPPDEKDIAVLREGRSRTPALAAWTKPLTEKTTVKRSPRRKVGRQREGPGYRTDIPIIEGFALPDDLVEAEKYVDTLVASGVDEYQVWQSVQAHFAKRGM